MRNVPHIWEAWKSGVYVGENKPTTRVTVEKAHTLRLTESILGQWSRGPARWFQREFPHPEEPSPRNRPQIETELPNILTVSTDESIDSDVASCEITMANILMPVLGEAPEADGQFGRPGYFTWARGDSVEARARWGQAPNAWSKVLRPNALIRVYQGFGGHDKLLPDAIADGNVVIKGTFFVDRVRVNASGNLVLICRNAGKLLVDQSLYPPLVPKALYPVHYQRYTFETFTIPKEPVPDKGKIITHPMSFAPPIDLGPMASSPGEAGHVLAHAVDGDGYSYWLSEGKGGPGDSVFIEFYTYGKPVNQLLVHTWAGNYEMYVSVYEDGAWVSPEESVLGGIGPGGIPYVKRFVNQWEKSEELAMPRIYSAERIRLTFSNLTAAPEGGYRAGLRTFRAQENRLWSEYPVYVFASAAMPYNEENIEGYWQVRSNGKVYAFGDARIHPRTGGADQQYAVRGMTAHPSGLGYWTVDMKGRVCAYGNANWYGDLADEPGFSVVDIAPAPDGYGYYLLETDGTVTGFGSAVYLGDATVSGLMPSGGQVIARSIESVHPDQGVGYWVLRSDGNVQAFGDANHYGNANRTGFTPTEYVASIRRTSTGEGYWIPSGNARVQAFGDAVNAGNGFPYPPEKWAASLVWDIIPWSGGDSGYALQHADGKLDVLGDFGYYGSIGEGEGQLRKDGNYKDYADIIRDLLLWSGFYLYRYPAEPTKPAVHGNIETTGAYAILPLPDEMFDKKPAMEAITAIKEIVGYVFWIDESGAAHFESPNWWTIGNFDETGQRIDLMPEIDEAVQLTDHQSELSDADARSEITLASAAPTANFKGTIVSTITPPGFDLLKGLVKPAIWANGNFDDEEEQYAMAELIAMHIWFSLRQSSTTCVGNPLISINDQVRIYERVTGETYINYVRGIRTMWDAVSGNYEMTLTTHWLGGVPTLDLPLLYACAMTPDGFGYYQAASDGQIFAFGSAELYACNEDDFHTEDLIGIRTTPSGLGYWTLDSSGKILSYGDAEHFGDLQRDELDVRGFAINPAGDGYWIILANGGIWNFGGATEHLSPIWGGHLWNGNPATAASIEAHPTEDGLWVLYTDGAVLGVGDGTFTGVAPSLAGGSSRGDEYRVLRTNIDGTGVWAVTARGVVADLGNDVPDFGDANPYPPEDAAFGAVWDMMPVRFPGDMGYAIQHADGNLDFFADFPFEGAVGANSAYAGKRNYVWAITPVENHPPLPDNPSRPLDRITVSPRVIERLKRTGSPGAKEAITNGFGAPEEATIKAVPV